MEVNEKNRTTARTNDIDGLMINRRTNIILMEMEECMGRALKTATLEIRGMYEEIICTLSTEVADLRERVTTLETGKERSTGSEKPSVESIPSGEGATTRTEPRDKTEGRKNREEHEERRTQAEVPRTDIRFWMSKPGTAANDQTTTNSNITKKDIAEPPTEPAAPDRQAPKVIFRTRDASPFKTATTDRPMMPKNSCALVSAINMVAQGTWKHDVVVKT